jgi:hypothetical protein
VGEGPHVLRPHEAAWILLTGHRMTYSAEQDDRHDLVHHQGDRPVLTAGGRAVRFRSARRRLLRRHHATGVHPRSWAWTSGGTGWPASRPSPVPPSRECSTIGSCSRPTPTRRVVACARSPGIGAFTAELILVRAVGHTDLLPVSEPRLLALVGELYGLGRPATGRELESIGAAWAPFRTWVSVLVRASAHRAASVATC